MKSNGASSNTKEGECGEPQSPVRRIINRSVHEAIIKLIPIQAQRIREKSVSRSQQPAVDAPPQKEKPPKKPKRPVHWEKEDETVEKHSPEAEEFDKIWENDCESRALACEEKLKAFLSRCESQVPNASRVAVSLQMMKEVCVVCPPFAHVLSEIFKELELALYCCALDKQNNELQVPYFELVTRLEESMGKKEESDKNWRSSLSDYQSQIERIEQNMEALRGQVKSADFLNKNLNASIATATGSLDAANNQVHLSKQKLMELKKELKEARAEVRRAGSVEVKLQHEEDVMKQEQSKAEYGQLVNELKHFQTFLDAARTQIASCVPRGDYLAMKAQMLELQQRLADIQAKSVKLTFQTAHLTPRPEWKQVGGHDPTLSTLEQVAQICRQNAVLSNKLSKLQTEWTDTNVALAEATGKYQAQKGKKKK